MAKRELRGFMDELENTAPDAHKTRLDEYVTDFLAGRTGAPKTLKRYGQLAEHIKKSWPSGAQKALRNVHLSQCTRWLSQWNGKVATYNHARQWLMAFFDYAVANGKIQKSPLEKGNVKAMRRPKVIRNAPSPEEFEKILAEIRAQRFTNHADDTGNVVEFMGRAGVGQAEANGLRWQDIDFNGGALKLFRVKTKTAYQIQIFPKLRPLLDGLQLANPDAAPTDRVFNVDGPKKGLAAACKRLKLPNYSPRSLRRMFIIEALKRQVPVKTISRWQGHQDGGVLILKTYSETIDQGVKQAAAVCLLKIADDQGNEPSQTALTNLLSLGGSTTPPRFNGRKVDMLSRRVLVWLHGKEEESIG